MITVKPHGISTFRDVSVDVRVPLTRDGSTFFPDDDWDLVFTAKLSLEDDDVDAVVQKSTVAGITVDGRFAVLEIVPLDTTTLVANTILYCDVKGTNDVLSETGVFATFLWRVGVSASLEDVTSIPVFTTNPPAGRQLSNVATAGYTAGNMLRIASAGGLEERTPEQVKNDIGADASVAALTFAGSDPNGMREIRIQSDDAFVDGAVLIYAGTVFGEHFWSISGNLPDDGGSYTSDELHLTCADVDIRLIFEGGVIAYSSSATHAETEPWLDSPIPPFGTGVFEIILIEGDSTAGATATHLGQLCKASTAWWQWDGSAWIPRFTLAGDPIAYNATLSAFRKLVVSGADGSEIITISAL